MGYEKLKNCEKKFGKNGGMMRKFLKNSQEISDFFLIFFVGKFLEIFLLTFNPNDLKTPNSQAFSFTFAVKDNHNTKKHNITAITDTIL